jgi:hypothetical protein
MEITVAADQTVGAAAQCKPDKLVVVGIPAVALALRAGQFAPFAHCTQSL